MADMGEDAFLTQVFQLLTPGSHTVVPAGDDAAVVRAPDGNVVVTTDTLVQDVDFRLEWSAAGDVGHKAAMQNLADVAAMGAVPTGYVMTLVAPPQTPVQWALEATQAIVDACAPFGAAALGGDLSGGPTLMLSLTMLGDLQRRPAVCRSGARPGDVMALAGEVGWSAAGLDLLGRGVATADAMRAALPAGCVPLAQRALLAHRRPQPPITCGPLAAQAGAHAMIDTSDGLVRDAGRLARASVVQITLAADSPGLSGTMAQLSRLAEGLGEMESASTWLLGGGEDHALLAAFGAEADLPPGFTVVGRVREPSSDGPGSEQVALEEGDFHDGFAPGRGFDHFTSRPSHL